MKRLGRPGAMRSGSRFAHLLLLLVLAWQGVVLQSHTHYAPVAGAAVGTSAAMPVVAAATAVADDHAFSAIPSAPPCFLCEEQALFGAYVLAGPVATIVPMANVAWYDAIAGPYAVVLQFSHSWRSRAPPSLPGLSTS